MDKLSTLLILPCSIRLVHHLKLPLLLSPDCDIGIDVEPEYDGDRDDDTEDEESQSLSQRRSISLVQKPTPLNKPRGISLPVIPPSCSSGYDIEIDFRDDGNRIDDGEYAGNNAQINLNPEIEPGVSFRSFWTRS